jgi:hypothetical protein
MSRTNEQKKPEPVNFRVHLTKHEWDMLDFMREMDGKTDRRRYVNCELHRFAGRHKGLPACKVKQPKRVSFFPVPADLLEFYQALACHLNIQVGTVIMRYVILPRLHACEQLFRTLGAEVERELHVPATSPLASSDITAPPVFEPLMWAPPKKEAEPVYTVIPGPAKAVVTKRGK